MLLDGVWVENLVRFPVERRSLPSFEMMSELAPDGRMIPHILEALDIEDYDPDLQDNADREMAESVALMKAPQNDEARRQFFGALREQAVKPAIAASVEAKRVADEAYRASRRAIDAETGDPLNAFALGRLANRFLNTSARTALRAHELCEIARGKCRALTLAEMHEPWVPFDIQEAGAWLVDEGKRAIARKAAGKG